MSKSWSILGGRKAGAKVGTRRKELKQRLEGRFLTLLTNQGNVLETCLQAHMIGMMSQLRFLLHSCPKYALSRQNTNSTMPGSESRG